MSLLESQLHQSKSCSWKIRFKSSLGLPNHVAIFVDVPNPQSQDDASGYPDGGLPTRRQTAQFLQEYHLVGRCNGEGCRFPPERNGPSRTRSVK